ncbi:MAG: glycosyl hydrolase [Bacteroidales bacterium]
MNRRKFLSKSALFSAGTLMAGKLSAAGARIYSGNDYQTADGSYELFRNPSPEYHPFVRWWWNGNKIESDELKRELRLLRDAGIGGVEINPVQFPNRFEGDDLGKQSLTWLSDEWIEMLRVTFGEAKLLGMTCDLIVGSGWPFGAEYLTGEERAQIAVIAVQKLTGPLDYEISQFEIFKEADPAVSSPFPGRVPELLSLNLVPDPLISMDEVKDLSDQINNQTIRIPVPKGKYALYALVRINGFMQVINGSPGATGPVLNHYNEIAVREYLNRMSDTIEEQTGPLSDYLRALFTDSMELEGSNWSAGILEEFRRRRGYDIFPFLPFVLFKTGGMGNVTDFNYGVKYSEELEAVIRRMRYDFEVTKAEILEERFIKPYVEWCRKLNVKSRAQAYGRGFFPLESSFHYDIPESESWTMNWLRHRIGEEMPEDDYRRGRAYTMINKYVSSAANLTGKRLVSCEEMTDTYKVFNTSLEDLKVGGDQGIITGVTHSVFHGFNYSPPDAPFPGWIRYGAYYNENNTWWPYFRFYNEYKARLSALLQQADMYTDIAILPPLDDMWSIIGSQMEPFPSLTHVDYFTLVWEAANKNGNGCDYVSQRVIADSEIENGFLIYGPKKYHTLFMVQVDSLSTPAAEKLVKFIESGGRIFCIETIPSGSPGWKDHERRDQEVRKLIERMKTYPDRFIMIRKPEKDFLGWYKGLQKKYGIEPYVMIEDPSPYVMQTRYRTDDDKEFVYIVHSHIHDSHQTRIAFSGELTRQRYCWTWDPETGNRYRIELDRDSGISLDLGPAQSILFVFDRERGGAEWKPKPAGNEKIRVITEGWSSEFRHCRDESVKILPMDVLRDLKDIPEFIHFAGTVIYRNRIKAGQSGIRYINLGKVFGISELKVNGEDCGTIWYGRRIWDIGALLRQGDNEIEIKVITSMGNYMKSLTDNPIAQYWTNEKNKIQPIQSMGLVGPVTIY